MSIENVRAYLTRFDLQDRIQERQKALLGIFRGKDVLKNHVIRRQKLKIIFQHRSSPSCSSPESIIVCVLPKVKMPKQIFSKISDFPFQKSLFYRKITLN